MGYKEIPSNFALGTEARRARDRVVDEELNALAGAALAQLDADSSRQKSYEEVVVERDEAVRKYRALQMRVINAPRSVAVGPISSSVNTLTVLGNVRAPGTYGIVLLERDEILRGGTDEDNR